MPWVVSSHSVPRGSAGSRGRSGFRVIEVVLEMMGFRSGPVKEGPRSYANCCLGSRESALRYTTARRPGADSDTEETRAGHRAVKQFHTFRLDPVNHRLWRGDERVALTPKAFDVLR